MSRFSDEQLVAYVDGELPEAQRREIAAAAEKDRVLAARIDGFTRTRHLLAEHFSPLLQEPVPDRLLRSLQEQESASAGTSARLGRSRWRPLALAASVALMLGLWLGLVLAPDRQALLLAGMPAQTEALHGLLESAPSGVPAAVRARGQTYEMMVTGTLRVAAGYCREFTVETDDAAAAARGLACRDGNGRWQLRAWEQGLHDLPARTGTEYRTAGGASRSISADTSAERLSPQAEAEILARGWRESPEGQERGAAKP